MRAGATSAGLIPLRLPFAVKEIFSEWLTRHFPDRKENVLNRLRSLRGGKLNQAEIEDVFMGCANPEGTQGTNVARIAAMRAGLPVIASDLPGIREQLGDGRSGVLVPGNHPRAFADALREINAAKKTGFKVNPELEKAIRSKQK